MSKIAPSNITLIRGLGLIAAISIIIGNVIGTGVFLKARIMICNVGSPSKVILVWVAAGVLSLAGALTYAELAAMMPRAGGEYVFIREAYGAPLGFLYGWTQVFIGKAGSQAAVAVALATFLNDLIGGKLSHNFFTAHVFSFQIPFGSLQVVAISAIVIVTLLNCLHVIVSGGVAVFLTIIKISLVLGLGVGAFFFARGDWAHYVMSNVSGACYGVADSARYGVLGFGAAMIGALWGYDGWNNLTLVAGEVKNPQRNIPRALIGGMLIIITLYVFINIAYFYVLDPTTIASIQTTSSVAREVALSFLGPVAVSLIALALFASSLGTLHTSVLTGARVPYAMARDRLFFQNLARLSKRTHVPIGALVIQGIWASVLALSGSFDTLTDYVIFGSWIFYGLATASVFIFRRTMPNADRPYRAWGYPVVPVLFLLVTAGLLFNTVWATPVQALDGLGLIVLGLPVYFYWSRYNRGKNLKTEEEGQE